MVWKIILCANIAAFACLVCHGETGESNKEVEIKKEKNQSGKALVLGANQDYPPPPPEFQDLVKRGAVTFQFYDPKKSLPQEFPAVTKFDLRYWYRSDNPTSLEVREGKQGILVKPRWRSISLQVVHRIEVSNIYQTAEFWTLPLIRHEMDHVRISSDPYWIDRFRQAIESVSDIWVPVTGEISPRQVAKLARDAVEKAVTESIATVTELLRIRYSELDRITQHGQLPLPAGFWGL